jgi:alkaline phosphatase D
VHRGSRTGWALVVGLMLPSAAAADPSQFAYGVAAGEVKPSSAMLWTRSAPGGAITLKVSRVGALATCSAAPRSVPPGAHVLRKTLTARAAADKTVRSTVTGLHPATRYFYRFCGGGAASRLGQFTTAPERTADVPIRFGLSGDADGAINPATGLPAYNGFEVYRRMAVENNDFNVNLGDVMYSDSAVAGVPPALSLADKWGKYRLNLSYPNLRRLRSSAGLYSHWDDHEFIDDFSVPVFGTGLFASGAAAFLNYNPARYTPSSGLYRTFRWGKNVELFFLDERAFRSAPASTNPACINPVTGTPDPVPQLPQRLRDAISAQLNLPPAAAAPVSPECLSTINDPARTMLGKSQLQRFEQAIARSRATFKVIVNEVPIQQMYWLPYDRWEGYNAERQALLSFLHSRVRNVVFLTTDFHANLVNNVKFTTFAEEGPSIDTGFLDIVTGPVALKTFAVDTDLKTGFPGAANVVRALFKAPAPLGLGMKCAALNVYSYAEIDATARRMIVTLKDANGQRVKETPTGPSCPPLTIRPR